jgi:hypothetical protein
MQEGSRTTLILKCGRKYAYAVVVGVPVDIRVLHRNALTNPAGHGLRPMYKGTSLYPVGLAAKKLLEIGARLGITERARKLLVGSLQGS